MTVGSSAAESSALTGGGASLWASGSQLCTGAQPIFAASPTRIRISANSAVRWSRPAECRAMLCQSSVASVPPCGASPTNRIRIPSSATASPNVVSTRYFQPASSALRRPL